MELRPYADQDAVATRRVFQRTVRVTASRDYTSQQIDAWAPESWGSSDAAAWATARAAATTIVAVEGGEVVGFSDLAQDSLLDMLYVDPHVSRRGVGTARVRHIVSLARGSGVNELETYASLTARRLFERFEFVTVEQCTPIVRGIAMTNFRMRVELSADGLGGLITPREQPRRGSPGTRLASEQCARAPPRRRRSERS